MEKQTSKDSNGKSNGNGSRIVGLSAMTEILLPKTPEETCLMAEEYVPPKPQTTSSNNSWISVVQESLRDMRVRGQETKEELRRRKILMDTRLQLLKDRGDEVVKGFRSELGTEMKKLQYKFAEGLHAAELGAQQGVAAIKIAAMRELVTTHYHEMLAISADLPEEYRAVIVQNAMVVLKDALSKIHKTEVDFDEFIKKNYPPEDQNSWLHAIF